MGCDPAHNYAGRGPIEALDMGIELEPEDLEDIRVRFHHGVCFRSVVTVRQGVGLIDTQCTPAHGLADRPVAPYLPKGKEAELLRGLMDRSRDILSSHPINVEREM